MDISDEPGDYGIKSPELDEPFDAEKSMAFLRANGVEIETAEERAKKKNAAAVAASSSDSVPFSFVKIPAEATEAVSVEQGKWLLHGGDVLPSFLGPRFADNASLDAEVVGRETAQLMKGMVVSGGGIDNLKAPSVATLQENTKGGACEGWTLAQPSEKNDMRRVSLYIDEIGALRARPRNARAEALANACGLGGVSIHGDAYVGRVGKAPVGGWRNEDFGIAELDYTCKWVQIANEAHGERAREMELKDDDHLASGESEATGGQYSWTQTEEDVEVRVLRGIPQDGDAKVRKRRIHVGYGKGQSLVVKVDKEVVLELAQLFDRVAPDECSWSLDKSDGALVVQMEKVNVRAWAQLTLPSKWVPA